VPSRFASHPGFSVNLRGAPADRKSVYGATDAARLVAREPPKRIDVPAVVAGAVNGRLQNKSPPRELRMLQNSAESFTPDFAFANVLVAVKMRAECALRVIDMYHENAREADRSGNLSKRALLSFRAAQIMARGKQMRRVHAHTEGQRRAQIQNRLKLRKTRAH
jgi:hypothetical protein